MSVELYSKPNCPQCDATKRKLDELGVTATMFDISQDAAARQRVEDLGYKSVPVVVTDVEHWVGYRPDLLKGLV